MTFTDTRPRVLAALALLCTLLAFAPAAARAAAPDPLARGSYAPATLEQYKLGTVNLQEPNAAGGATTGMAAAATLQIRGSLYYPKDRATPSPILLLVHGNHTQCDVGASPQCTVFKRNDRGYAYMAENLASWGYTVASIDQDQLMYFQDNAMAKGMHQRRLLIAATLDALYKANETGLADDENTNVGDLLKGKLDFSRIGLMGHSRGGDAVTSFIDYNRTRPAPGRRYQLRGVISLAPVDYERRSPYGMPYMTILPMCDGDVSNIQGARFFERSQYIAPGDPFPRIQVAVHGTNHNWFNSVWSADSDDSTGSDPACGISQPGNIRLSGGVSTGPTSGPATNDVGLSPGGTYTRNNRGSGDPALMGDQNKVGLALMNAFFRRYVGGEAGFDEYMTGERSAAGETQLPASACPSQQVSLGGQGTDGTRMACAERIVTSYFAAPAERVDVLTPGTDDPLGLTALGTGLEATGFANPYVDGGGVTPKPATTATGLDWCNPEPDHFAPAQLGLTSLPAAKKACPLPAAGALGGQTNARENAPVNRSYGLQLAAAWEQPAALAVRIPSAKGDVSGLKALALGAAVNYFDDRNPSRTADALVNPEATTQDFTIALTDADGVSGAVSAASERYGNALHPTIGNTTARVHVLLNQIRVPLADFAAQGVDLTRVRKVELRFGEPGKPAKGSVQLADLRFQEAVSGPSVLVDPHDPAAAGAPAAATVAPAVVAPAPRTVASPARPDAIGIAGATVTTAGASCTDTAAPRTSIAALSVRGGRLGVSGRASDVGCAAAAAPSALAGGVKSVQVSLARTSGKACRFVTPRGTLTGATSCREPLALVAKGTTRWSLKLARKLPPGTYRVAVVALDAAGNTKTVTRKVTVR